MDEAQEIKEWVRVSASPKQTTVTVTLQQGNHTVKWSVRAYSTGLKKGLAEARSYAKQALTDIQQAYAELLAEEDAA